MLWQNMMNEFFKKNILRPILEGKDITEDDILSPTFDINVFLEDVYMRNPLSRSAKSAVKGVARDLPEYRGNISEFLDNIGTTEGLLDGNSLSTDTMEKVFGIPPKVTRLIQSKLDIKIDRTFRKAVARDPAAFVNYIKDNFNSRLKESGSTTMTLPDLKTMLNLILTDCDIPESDIRSILANIRVELKPIINKQRPQPHTANNNGHKENSTGVIRKSGERKIEVDDNTALVEWGVPDEGSTGDNSQDKALELLETGDYKGFLDAAQDTVLDGSGCTAALALLMESHKSFIDAVGKSKRTPSLIARLINGTDDTNALWAYLTLLKQDDSTIFKKVIATINPLTISQTIKEGGTLEGVVNIILAVENDKIARSILDATGVNIISSMMDRQNDLRYLSYSLWLMNRLDNSIGSKLLSMQIDHIFTLFSTSSMVDKIYTVWKIHNMDEAVASELVDQIECDLATPSEFSDIDELGRSVWHLSSVDTESSRILLNALGLDGIMELAKDTPVNKFGYVLQDISRVNKKLAKNVLSSYTSREKILLDSLSRSGYNDTRYFMWTGLSLSEDDAALVLSRSMTDEGYPLLEFKTITAGAEASSLSEDYLSVYSMALDVVKGMEGGPHTTTADEENDEEYEDDDILSAEDDDEDMQSSLPPTVDMKSKKSDPLEEVAMELGLMDSGISPAPQEAQEPQDNKDRARGILPPAKRLSRDIREKGVSFFLSELETIISKDRSSIDEIREGLDMRLVASHLLEDAKDFDTLVVYFQIISEQDSTIASGIYSNLMDLDISEHVRTISDLFHYVGYVRLFLELDVEVGRKLLMNTPEDYISLIVKSSKELPLIIELMGILNANLTKKKRLMIGRSLDRSELQKKMNMSDPDITLRFLCEVYELDHNLSIELAKKIDQKKLLNLISLADFESFSIVLYIIGEIYPGKADYILGRIKPGSIKQLYDLQSENTLPTLTRFMESTTRIDSEYPIRLLEQIGFDRLKALVEASEAGEICNFLEALWQCNPDYAERFMGKLYPRKISKIFMTKADPTDISRFTYIVSSIDPNLLEVFVTRKLKEVAVNSLRQMDDIEKQTFAIWTFWKAYPPMARAIIGELGDSLINSYAMEENVGKFINGIYALTDVDKNMALEILDAKESQWFVRQLAKGDDIRHIVFAIAKINEIDSQKASKIISLIGRDKILDWMESASLLNVIYVIQSLHNTSPSLCQEVIDAIDWEDVVKDVEAEPDMRGVGYFLQKLNEVDPSKASLILKHLSVEKISERLVSQGEKVRNYVLGIISLIDAKKGKLIYESLQG